MSFGHARRTAWVLVLLSTPATPTRATAQESNRFTELARRVVATSAAVKPGEVVVISGGKHTISLMEALGAEVARTGASPLLTLDSERVFGAFLRELPETHLRAYDSAGTAVYGDLLRRADVMIVLPPIENADSLLQTFAADTLRMGKVMQTLGASQRRFDELRNTARTRFVFINYPPTRTDIARSGLDAGAYDRMMWEAMTTDYDRIAAQGRALKRLLDTGKSVRITTPDGTDLRLRLTGRPAAMIGATLPAAQRGARLASQRTVTLPGGRVAVAPLETSANGKVVVARDACFGSPLVNARFELRAGRMTGFQADSGGACVTSFLESSPGPDDVMGVLSIGLNPALEPVETGVGYRPWEASGAVVLGLGNNSDLGGRNDTPAGFPFWLSRATVEIDGKVVVKDGQVLSDLTQGR